jgi:uncharacterized membrane protein YbjE (DUF340 family)
MILVFCVGLDIGSQQEIGKKIRSKIKTILIQTALTICGSLLFAGISGFFTGLSFKEAAGAGAGMGWYSLSGVMISDLYSAELGAVSFTANVIREVLAIVTIPLFSKVSELGAISVGGATTMDTMLGVVSISTSAENTLVAFGQGVLLSMAVPVLITLIFS